MGNTQKLKLQLPKQFTGVVKSLDRAAQRHQTHKHLYAEAQNAGVRNTLDIRSLEKLSQDLAELGRQRLRNINPHPSKWYSGNYIERRKV